MALSLSQISPLTNIWTPRKSRHVPQRASYLEVSLSFPVGLLSSLLWVSLLPWASTLLSFSERSPLTWLGPRKEEEAGTMPGSPLMSRAWKGAGQRLVLFYFPLPYNKQHAPLKVRPLMLLREGACDFSSCGREDQGWAWRGAGGRRPWA